MDPLLFYADGYKVPDVYHLTRFLSPDPIIALEDGDEIVFMAERLRAIVEGRLLELGCSSEGAIVAPGQQAADPHMIGTGPLCARQSIVMDIFPQDKATRYFADMTRTVSKGDPGDEIRRMYDVVKHAQ